VVALWAGVLVGPLTVLTQLQANYALVLWSCKTGIKWPLHLVSLLALFFTIAAGTLSCTNWFLLSDRAVEDGAGSISRSRFMAVLGTLVSILMSTVIIAMWLPIFLYGPCER
jgi:hypothetical protein